MTTFSLHNVFIFVMERQKIRVMERRFFFTKSCIASMYYAILRLFLFFSNDVVVGLEAVGCLKV